MCAAVETSFLQFLAAYAPDDGAGWEAFALVVGAISLWLFLLIRQSNRSAWRRDARIPARSELPQRVEPEPDGLPKEDVDHMEADRPLAVFLVGGDNRLGPLALRVFEDTYKDEFDQVLFASVGVMDHGILDSGVDPRRGFKGTEEARRLKRKTRLDLDPYIAAAHGLGLKADCRVRIGTSVVEEIARFAEEIVGIYPHSVFFVGKLIFERPRWFDRILFARTSDSIRKRLERKGIPVTIIPFVVPEDVSSGSRRIGLVEFTPKSKYRSAS